MTDALLVPPVSWAQRSHVVFLTINLEDVKDPNIKFNKDSVYFKGNGGPNQSSYELTIPLYKEIDPDKSKSLIRDRCVEIVLAKANTEDPYWPSLTTDKKKPFWLKCDFNKWQDEEDSGNEEGGDMNLGGDGDFAEMMRQMGGLQPPGGKPSYDFSQEEEDSDDEPIPDLE